MEHLKIWKIWKLVERLLVPRGTVHTNFGFLRIFGVRRLQRTEQTERQMEKQDPHYDSRIIKCHILHPAQNKITMEICQVRNHHTISSSLKSQKVADWKCIHQGCRERHFFSGQQEYCSHRIISANIHTHTDRQTMLNALWQNNQSPRTPHDCEL